MCVHRGSVNTVSRSATIVTLCTCTETGGYCSSAFMAGAEKNMGSPSTPTGRLRTYGAKWLALPARRSASSCTLPAVTVSSGVARLAENAAAALHGQYLESSSGDGHLQRKACAPQLRWHPVDKGEHCRAAVRAVGKLACCWQLDHDVVRAAGLRTGRSCQRFGQSCGV
jgi:hypothetical protein